MFLASYHEILEVITIDKSSVHVIKRSKSEVKVKVRGQNKFVTYLGISGP